MPRSDGLQLRDVQRSVLPSLRWLLSDDARGAGRSFVMAALFLEKALENPGLMVEFFDHADRTRRQLASAIMGIARVFGLQHFLFLSDRHVKYNPSASGSDILAIQKFREFLQVVPEEDGWDGFPLGSSDSK